MCHSLIDPKSVTALRQDFSAHRTYRFDVSTQQHRESTMKKIFTILFIFSIFLSACSSLTVKTPPENALTPTATQPPSTTTEIQPTPSPKVYTLRVEFSTTADWSRLTILDPGLIDGIRFIDKQGNFEGYSVEKNSILISQPTSPVLTNPNIQIKITVDLNVADNGSDTALPFLLEKGAINNTTIRFFNVSDGKAYLLLDEIVREGYVEGHTDLNPYNFSLDLKPLFQDIAVLPTPTMIPVLSLPVSQLTPVPSSNTGISAETIKDLQEIARYYADDVEYIAKLTKDSRFLFIADGDGADKYDYPSMTKLAHIAIPTTSLQITDDGIWLLINERWLVDLRDNSQPQTRDLLAEFPLKNLRIRTASLSPDGSLLMISDRKCSDTCTWDVAKVVNLRDGTTKDVPSLYGFLTTISSNGQYIAFSDQVSVNIWRTSDFEKVTTIKIDYPYVLTSIAFSEDGHRFAISQKTNIKIYDVQTGNMQTFIQGLCDTYQRDVIFAPHLPVRVVESSACDSGMWLIDQGRATKEQAGASYDLSKIKFDGDGHISSIPYPYSASELRAYRRQYYFQFMDADTLAFKNFAEHSLDRYTCVLSLSKGLINCKSNSEVFGDGQFTGTDQILGTDGQYYDYKVTRANVEIHSQGDSGKIYYSLPWKGYIFRIEALDPVNKLIFYEIALDVNNNREVIQDMENDHILNKFEGYTYFAPIAFSENKKFAAICQKVTYSGTPSIDKLIIFDLTKKAIVHSTNFTCDTTGGSLSLSADGSKLAAEYVSSFNGDTVNRQVLLLDIANGFTSQRFDVEAHQASATAYTPDGKMLAVMCTDDTVCFLDASNGQEMGRLKAHSGITHIALSKDGKLMATSSDWGLISLWAIPPFTNK